MQATAISAPERQVTLCGKTVTARFDHMAMRLAEIYFDETTGYRLGYLGILSRATSRTYAALGALAYGAAASATKAGGKWPMAIAEFEAKCAYDELLTAAEALLSGAEEALPKAKGEAKNA